MEPAKQRRAVAVYDCLAAGWTKTNLAQVLRSNRVSILNWAVEAEELGELKRWELRLEIVRSSRA